MDKILIICLMFINLCYSQIAYPEDNPMNSNDNANGREPVYIPGLCPVNQWYWPGNQDSDWVCDCANGFVYHPSSDTCHELYRQGPCPKNQYLLLEKGKIIPECFNNPCVNDTVVLFNGSCHRLYKTDACPPIGKLERTLNVNHTSLELECISAKTVQLNSNVVHIGSLSCLPGSKRSANGQCRIIAG